MRTRSRPRQKRWPRRPPAPDRRLAHPRAPLPAQTTSTTGAIARALLLEAFLLSLGGGVVGVLLGLGGACALAQVPLPEPVDAAAHTIHSLAVVAPPTVGPSLAVEASVEVLVLALAASVIGGTLAGWSGARRAARLKPAQALRQS